MTMADSTDDDLDLRRYRTMEAAANRLQKEAKGYLDSLRGRLMSHRLRAVADLEQP
jgi:hypothetical protein